MLVDKKLQRVLDACEEGSEALTPFVNTKHRVTIRCKNGHLREVMPDKLFSRGDKKQCRQCDSYVYPTTTSNEEFSKECAVRGLTLIDKYINNHTRVNVTNNNCGHSYSINPNSLLTKNSGIICRICNIPNKEVEYTKYLEDVGLIPLTKYVNANIKILIRNSNCNHEYYVEPSSVLHKNSGIICRVCNPTNIKSMQEVHSELLSLNLELVGEYTGTKSNIMVRNLACGHTYSAIATNVFSKGQGKICRICNPNISGQEKEILEFIKRIYNGWIIEHDRSILDGKELDIVLPDLGIAIEYNGTYYHSTSNVRMNESYHLGKLNQVEDIGYRLINIAENEWLYKKDIVKSRLRSIFNETYRIHARTTKVRSISFPKEFLIHNHIQGAGSNCSVNYGLFLLNELVAVMTFSRPRFTKGYDYELVRFCSLLDISVIGGASKLLKQFRKDYPNSSIVSYSDKRWSSGNLYKQLGFNLSHTSKPNYNYYKYKYAYSRYQCQKHLLKDLLPDFYKEELSEAEIMGRAGFHKVYDCGNDVWVLK